MSGVSFGARAAAMAAPPLRWIRLAWKLAPIALLGALLLTRATLDRVKAEHQAEIAEIRRQSAEDDAKDARKGEAAANSYAARAIALQPLIVKSKDTVTTYAQTPAGRAPCLSADRVRGIDDLDAALFTPPDPAGAARALHPDAAAPPAGRNGDQR